MESLYSDLYHEILSFCDKNARYNLKFVNKFFSKLIGKIYDDKLDFWRNLIKELNFCRDCRDCRDYRDLTTELDINYLPIIYRVRFIDEYFLIAYSLTQPREFYQIINMRLDISNRFSEDLFLFELNTVHGIRVIIFSVIKLLKIVEEFGENVYNNEHNLWQDELYLNEKIIKDLNKLFTECGECDFYMSESFTIYNWSTYEISETFEEQICKLKHDFDAHTCYKVKEPENGKFNLKLVQFFGVQLNLYIQIY